MSRRQNSVHVSLQYGYAIGKGKDFTAMSRFDEYDVQLVQGIQKFNGEKTDYIVDGDDHTAKITDCEDHALLIQRAFCAGRAAEAHEHVTSQRDPSNVSLMSLDRVPHAPGYEPSSPPPSTPLSRILPPH